MQSSNPAAVIDGAVARSLAALRRVVVLFATSAEAPHHRLRSSITVITSRT